MKTTRIFLLMLALFACLNVARPAYALPYCSNCNCTKPCSTRCVQPTGEVGHCSDTGFCHEFCILE
jgi:hypothetical protein